MPDAHALLSLSASSKWLACPPALAMELPFPNTTSAASEAGTRAHALGEWKIIKAVGKGVYTTNPPPCDDESMDEHTDDYRDFVLAEAGPNPDYFQVEVQVETGVPDCWGTSDVIIVADGVLKVIDLKYGYRKVSAQGNPQLKGYGLGALLEVMDLHTVTRVECIIFQPRLGWIDRASYTVEEILAFQAELLAAGNAAKKYLLTAKYTTPESIATLHAGLNPGEKQCEWCRARSVCPALAAQVATEVSGRPATFEDLTVADRKDLEARPADMLAAHMAAVDKIEGWCKAVRAETDARLHRGDAVPGWKIVQGKKGNRKWGDAEEAEKQLKAARLKNEEMYDRTVISPTKAEKLLKERPRTWNKLAALITQSEGSEHVAPEDDPREAITKRKPGEAFEDITAEAEDPDLALLGS